MATSHRNGLGSHAHIGKYQLVALRGVNAKIAIGIGYGPRSWSALQCNAHARERFARSIFHCALYNILGNSRNS